MKALVVIAHCFKPRAKPTYSSQDAGRREVRRRALERTLLCWRAHVGETATLNVGRLAFQVDAGLVSKVDLVVLIHKDDHLLDADLINRFGVRVVRVVGGNPMLLPFGAHQLMERERANYDWFVYSEDDLALTDGALFSKLAQFQQAFGPTRVLQPNRFELNCDGVRPKTYIDGDLTDAYIGPHLARMPEKHENLALRVGTEQTLFRRARNPHAGFFALTAEQFAHWQKQPHFMDLDCSFWSALESAATLGLLKTFSVYKAVAPHMGFLELEHLDRKYSAMRLPERKPVAMLN